MLEKHYILIYDHNQQLTDSGACLDRRRPILQKGIENEFIIFPKILKYENISEIHAVVFLNFMTDFVKEFEARLQNFSEIDKLSQCFNSFPYLPLRQVGSQCCKWATFI